MLTCKITVNYSGATKTTKNTQWKKQENSTLQHKKIQQQQQQKHTHKSKHKKNQQCIRTLYKYSNKN